MTVGSRRVHINNLERALSSDINRLQTFKDTSIRELARWMFGVQEENGDLYPGYITETPASAVAPYQNSVIVNGLMPYPLNGTTTMFVSQGLVFMEDGAATADENSFCYVNDPGVDTGGVLVLTPAPGAIRIDIIECRLIEETLETDNRDIFNAATSLFTPALVDKVLAGRLEYRIREGVPGGGFPGVVADWLPLAIVSVASAAASWDDCEIWDVRPLLRGSHKPPFISWKNDADTSVFWSSASYDTGGIPPLYCTGKSVVALGPYNQSGIIGNHPTGDPWVDLADADNWEPGAVPIADLPYYLWALTPFGLPSWRKYTGSAVSPRRPVGMAGIMAVTMTAPTSRGYPSLPIAVPTATGLGGNTQYGAVVAAGMVNPAGTAGMPFVSDGNWVYLSQFPEIIPTVASAAIGASQSEYAWVDGLYYPPNAKALKVNVVRGLLNGADVTGHMEWGAYLLDAVTGERVARVASGSESIVLLTPSATVSIKFEIPLAFNLTLIGTRILEIEMSTRWSAAGTTLAYEYLIVEGWKMTP